MTVKAPLDGIRVLDFGHIVAGPFSARMLADLGADVVKVETKAREGQLGARKGKSGKPSPSHGRTALLGHVNRSRRSVDIDLKTDAGRELALRLIGAADVLIENFSSGVMERLGLGYEVLRKVNPRLIYASMSGYGHTGPRRDWISMNVNLQAHCALMLVTGAPGDPPIGISNSWNDYIAGLHASLAIVGALAERQRTGLGRHLDVSQFEACVATVGGLVWSSAVSKSAPPRQGNRSTEFAPQGCYRCAGKDQWCALSVRDDKQWQALSKLIGLSGPEYAHVAGRLTRQDAIDASIEAWTRTQPKEEVEARLKAAGVSAERVRRANELFEAPEWDELAPSIEDSPGVQVRVVGIPFRFGKSANTAPFPAPRMGAHTDEVTREWLGVAEEAAR